jgi:hypothetical protein
LQIDQVSQNSDFVDMVTLNDKGDKIWDKVIPNKQPKRNYHFLWLEVLVYSVVLENGNNNFKELLHYHEDSFNHSKLGFTISDHILQTEYDAIWSTGW